MKDLFNVKLIKNTRMDSPEFQVNFKFDKDTVEKAHFDVDFEDNYSLFLYALIDMLYNYHFEDQSKTLSPINIEAFNKIKSLLISIKEEDKWRYDEIKDGDIMYGDLLKLTIRLGRRGEHTAVYISKQTAWGGYITSFKDLSITNNIVNWIINYYWDNVNLSSLDFNIFEKMIYGFPKTTGLKFEANNEYLNDTYLHDSRYFMSLYNRKDIYDYTPVKLIINKEHSKVLEKITKYEFINNTEDDTIVLYLTGIDGYKASDEIVEEFKMFFNLGSLTLKIDDKFNDKLILVYYLLNCHKITKY